MILEIPVRHVHAQVTEEAFKKMILENRQLTQENNLLKNRIRRLEELLGENNVIGTTSSEFMKFFPQDIENNDKSAREILITISTAAENYAKNNYGSYPASIEFLLEANPPYLTVNYCGLTMAGFVYTCETSIIGYTITATPVEKNVTGSSVFTISTGRILNSERSQ